jgi:F-type H+-transporting ATPase subunit b
MSELFEAFGLDWRLLLVNMLNFGLLLLALWYFLYGPLMRLLEERREKVAKGVADAEESGRMLKEVANSRAVTLAAAGTDADSIIAAARASGMAKEQELLEKGQVATEAILREAEAQAVELKAQALEESRQEVAKLVVLGLEQAWSKK